MSTTLKSDLSHQIREYEKVFKSYQEFSSMLEIYFKKACQSAIPQAIVQTRTKTLSSFAEKAIRKADTYPDPINQFGDLCGARIIVHTLEQVRWVNEFIEKNFEIIEKEDVQKRLGNNQFGYLSMHYNVTIKPHFKYGISNKLLKTISGKKAEIQVKTILQHAWSDILHDRTYKGKAELPEDIKRNAAILAALMEEGDEKFERVVERIDNYSLNFTAYMTKEEITNEIETLTRLLELEPSNGNKISTALKLAKLTSLANQDYKKVEELLLPYENTPCHERPYLMLELGLAHCKLNRTNPGSKEYKKGQELFRKVVEECNGNGYNQVIDHQKLKSLKALAQARLAWSYEPVHEIRSLTSNHYHQALKLEPANPYYLSESLGYHHSLQNKKPVPEELNLLINAAIDTSASHARAGIELPQAHFTRGRLHLLTGNFEVAYGLYARGIQHFLDKNQYSPKDTLEREESWLHLLACPGDNENIDHIRTLLLMGKAVYGDIEAKTSLFEICSERNIPQIEGNVLIIAGGASLMNRAGINSAELMLEIALQDFEGTTISGGTTAGIPGIVGKVVTKLKRKGKKINLIGYIPSHLPEDAPKNKEYDSIIKCKGKAFSADQLHQSWIDILRAGINPETIKLLGINGGKISAMEYRLATTLGAQTGIIMKTGREADVLFSDPDWNSIPNLMFIPNDPASISLFISQEKFPFDEAKLEELAREAHQTYFEKRILENSDQSLRQWTDLDVSLKDSNRQQVSCAVFNLGKAGFEVKQVGGSKAGSFTFLPVEIELLAELEHGRWNAERLLNGWRYGPVKDVTNKINPFIIPWKELTDRIKQYDRDAIVAFPRILAGAGLEISRMENQNEIFDRTRRMLDSRF